MRVLLDCSTSKMGGAKTYAEEFLRALGELPEKDPWLVFGPPGCLRDWPRARAGIEIRERPSSQGSPAGTLLWLTRILPKIVAQERVSVVFAATGFGMINPACPQILLVRNPVYFSDLYLSRARGPGLKFDLLARRWLSLRALRASQAVIFPTRAMQELVERHTPPSRGWHVVPYGCDTRMFHPGTADPEDLPAPLRPFHGEFLLNVSHYCAQKNFTVLFQALGILRERGPIPRLALTTRLRPAPNCNFAEDSALIRRNQLSSDVVELGPVQRPATAALYRAARFFLFPSYVESFGPPLVEAMASGLPVLAADTSVNREICSDAALYADPFNPSAWADRVEQLLADAPLRRRLAEQGVSRARQFDWGRHTAQIAGLCRELSNGS